MTKNQLLNWYGSCYDPSGYGEATRGYVTEMYKQGCRNIKLTPVKFWHGENPRFTPDTLEAMEYCVKHEVDPGYWRDSSSIIAMNLTPNNYDIPLGVRGKMVGITTFETDRVPESWLTQMRAMDKIITFSEFNLQTFRAAGVNIPISVVPHGVDTYKYSPGVGSLECIKNLREEAFVFGANLDWNPRKNPVGMIHAYLKAFQNIKDVVLVLKCYYQYPYSKSKAAVREFVEKARHESDVPVSEQPRIVILNQILDSEDMPKFYNSLNCFVSCSRGEGWGLCLSESMSCGLPTIATNWSGNTTFMNKNNSYLMDYEMQRIPENLVVNQPHYAGHFWADPKFESIIETMREVYGKSVNARRVGKTAMKDMRTKWTWELAAKKMQIALTR